ncbi:uncharacterized protein J3D65DRAFT_172104 [Phyllosticta citribraziliensis]|uniref:Uncharacterized protein n=1 Tax=Phyllosticta citribraziliensis TaxID=989973 RepID=A0ABR1L4J3_9PEZI
MYTRTPVPRLRLQYTSPPPNATHGQPASHRIGRRNLLYVRMWGRKGYRLLRNGARLASCTSCLSLCFEPRFSSLSLSSHTCPKLRLVQTDCPLRVERRRAWRARTSHARGCGSARRSLSLLAPRAVGSVGRARARARAPGRERASVRRVGWTDDSGATAKHSLTAARCAVLCVFPIDTVSRPASRPQHTQPRTHHNG